MDEKDELPRYSTLLRVLRAKQSMTRKQFAVTLNVAVTTYANAENGRGSPVVFRRLAESFAEESKDVLDAWTEHREWELIPEAPPGWIPEDEAIKQIQEWSGRTRMTNLAISRLEETSRSDIGLVLALLVTIFMTQDDVQDTSRAFVNYLLSGFRPLTEQFDSNGYVEINGISLLRWLDGRGNWQLRSRKEGWGGEIYETDEDDADEVDDED